tara:strand:- start:3270 stop:4907 length:1638 start_codon:yes stop_codon:yes gene_type:complete
MFKTLKKGFFPFLIAFSALSVSASAAFYSVYGLSKLFAGAQLEVIIMAGSLEFAKLVTASLLYQYWDTINKWLRTYLTIAAVTLVLITSMGIYGFLSAAYQETYQKLVVQENQIEFLDNKAKFYEEDLTRYDEELERISNNISTLSNARSQSIQVRDTSVVGGVRSTISTAELRLAQSRINVEEENRRGVQAKREVAADSLQNIKLKILDIQNQSDTVGELGPLQYLSGLTGTPMDKIINILLLVIIFVFDPLAISLVVAANFAFDRAFPTKPEDEPVGPDLGNSIWDDMDEDVQEDHKDEYYDDDYGQEATWRFDDEMADKPAEPTVPFDISVNKEDAQGWYDIADQLAKGTAEMEEEDPFEDPEVQDFLERADEPGPWSEEDDKIHTVGGLTNDKESGFMDFQDKMDENDLAREIDVIDPEEVSKKFEVENTQGDVTVVDETETEADRIGTFPNENNPTSVAATVQKVKNEFGTYPEIVEKIDTPHLPKEEITTTTTIPPVVEPEEEVEEIDEDELFKQAMRAKAEEDMKDFLKNKEDGDKQD